MSAAKPAPPKKKAGSKARQPAFESTGIADVDGIIQKLTEDEDMAPAVVARMAKAVKDIDRDHDGVISPAEIVNHVLRQLTAEQRKNEMNFLAGAMTSSAELAVRYSEVYDTSPPLPRPLRSKFAKSLQYITASGFSREARMIAPLNKFDVDKLKEQRMEKARSLPSDGIIARVTKRNVVFLRKVTEFELVHRELSNGYSKKIKIIETVQTAISALLSIGLLLADTLPKDQLDQMVTGVAILTLFMGVLKQWVTVAKYEEYEAKHSTSANGFMKLKEDITSLLATLSDSTKEEVANNVTTGMNALSDEFLTGEGGSNAATAAIKSMMPVTGGGPSDGQADPDPEEASSLDSMFSNNLGPEGEPAKVMSVRMMYRHAIEYRVAHGFIESKYFRHHILVSFCHLLLSSVTSGVLFLSQKGDNPRLTLAGKILSLALTALNSSVQGLNLPQKAARHTNARLIFAGLQRELATRLMIDTYEQLNEKYKTLADNYRDAKCGSVQIADVDLLAMRGEHDGVPGPLFPLITPPGSEKSGLFACFGTPGSDDLEAGTAIKGTSV